MKVRVAELTLSRFPGMVCSLRQRSAEAGCTRVRAVSGILAEGLVKMDESGDHRLQTERGVWLCTLRPDGSAHITPVWFVYISDTWWIGCRATSVKVRNVRADPRVVLTLTDPDRPLVAQGLAEVHSAAEFPAVVMSAFMAKYDWNPATIDGSGASRVLVRVSGERWLMAGKPG